MLSLDYNQKFGVCHALLEYGDWEGASALMKLFPPFLAVWSPPVTKSLCSLVSHAIDPLYRRCALFCVFCIISQLLFETTLSKVLFCYLVFPIHCGAIECLKNSCDIDAGTASTMSFFVLYSLSVSE